MSYWVKYQERVRMDSQHKRKDKTSIKGSDDIIRSRQKKVRGSPKLAEGGIYPVTPQFKKACEKLGIPMTRRQLSKFHRGRGAALSWVRNLN